MKSFCFGLLNFLFPQYKISKKVSINEPNYIFNAKNLLRVSSVLIKISRSKMKPITKDLSSFGILI